MSDLIAGPARARRAGALRVGFFGVLGSGNLGNDGSLDALITYLREQHPDIQFRFLAMGPEKLQERYGVPATPLQWYEAHADSFRRMPAPVLKIVGRVLDPFRALLWMQDVDVAVVPGMGILETTVPMRPWGFPYGLLTVCAAARLSGTTVAMVCVGADVVRKRLSRLLITSAARLAHYRSYRDHLSREAMRTMGIDVSADDVYPDVAFAHRPPATAPDGAETVGLGLMDFWGNNDERSEAIRLNATYIDTMCRFAGWLVDRGRPIRFLTCDPADTTVTETVMDHVRRTHPHLPSSMLISEPAESLQELMKQMVSVDAVVATRYHNVVAAVQMNLPTVSVSYSAKHDELMAAMGLGEFCQQARSVDFDRLVEQFTTLESRGEELRTAMVAANQRNVESVERQLTALSVVLTSARAHTEAPVR